MSAFSVTVDSGSRVKLPTAGKYCPEDILVTATQGQDCNTGYAAGHAAGYAAGQTAEYDRFWDVYQNNGKRTTYQDMFRSRGWNDEIYNPKYPIICTGDRYAAYVVFSGAVNITNTKVPIEVRCDVAQGIFSGCTALKTIPYLGLFGVTDLNSAFTQCKALEDVTIDGSIDVNFNISATAVLTETSVQSIIDHLKDLTGQTSQSLTFHTDVGARLTDAQKATITAKNWTLVY